MGVQLLLNALCLFGCGNDVPEDSTVRRRPRLSRFSSAVTEDFIVSGLSVPKHAHKKKKKEKKTSASFSTSPQGAASLDIMFFGFCLFFESLISLRVKNCDISRLAVCFCDSVIKVIVQSCFTLDFAGRFDLRMKMYEEKEEGEKNTAAVLNGKGLNV